MHHDDDVAPAPCSRTAPETTAHSLGCAGTAPAPRAELPERIS